LYYRELLAWHQENHKVIRGGKAAGGYCIFKLWQVFAKLQDSVKSCRGMRGVILNLVRDSAVFNSFQWFVRLRKSVLFFSMMAIAPACLTCDLFADVVKDIDEAPGYEAPKDVKRDWTLSIGLASSVSPDYEGSNDYKFSYGPHLTASWQDTVFFKGKTLGANLFHYADLKCGPILAWTPGRNEDDNDKLAGMGDVDPSVEAGVFVTYRNKPLRFNLEARQDIRSGHEGALVELTAGTAIPVENPFVLVELGTTWASARVFSGSIPSSRRTRDWRNTMPVPGLRI
jgi:hypothetical protein